MVGRLSALNEREKQTLRLILDGHDAKSAAVALGLSVHTINEYLRQARRKLGVTSSREAARLLGQAERHYNSLGHTNLGVAPRPRDGGDAVDVHRRRTPRPLTRLLGGIAIMLAVVIAVALSVVSHQGPDGPAPAAQVSQSAKDKAAVASAEQWVKLLDARRWEDSWRVSGATFRSQLSPADWVSTIQPLRPPMGAVSSRALKAMSSASSLPGAPDGNYKIVQFETNFANRRGAVETVVLAQEGANWKVNGYFIR